MTVAIGVASADGLVIATDSRTTFQLNEAAPTRVLSDFTRKLFKTGNHAIATYGWAFLQERNIAGHMAEFAAYADSEQWNLEHLANELTSFFGDRVDAHLASGYDPPPLPEQIVLGFFVGGYQEGSGRLYEVLLPSRDLSIIANTATNPGAAWRGQTDVIRRLVKGVDLDSLLAFVQASNNTEVYDQIKNDLMKLEYIIPFAAMNLQDAVDFASFAIRTTIDTQRLTYGLVGAPGSWPGVGGPIEIATVTPTEGFQWVQRTQVQGERQAGEAEDV